jgi:V/A-type H+-transporting ATPase subunit A
MALLQRERELVEVAELVGTEALQDAERLVMESARLLREGFLRQSSYDPDDASCPPQKARELLAAHLDLHAQAGAAVARGVPLRVVLDAGLGSRLLALARVAAPEVKAAAAALRADAARVLGALEAE